MITLSLCMIVKDEERTLEKCLESIKGIPDEIIIVDTGSIDRTKKIARTWTQKIFDFEWNDNFSDARNFSFNQASMDYILWLDADDILLPEDYQKLLRLKQELHEEYDVVSMIYHAGFDQYNNVLTSILRNRIVKREKNFKWCGVVHEDLDINNTYNTYESNIVVTHTKGPTDEISSRNLKIYEKFYKNNADKMNLQDMFHYARELHSHKQYRQAIEFYSKCLESKEIQLPHRLFVMHKLASCYYLIGNFEKEKEITLHSLEYDFPQPEFCCRLGEMFIKKEQFPQAIFWYKQALESSKSNSIFIEQHPFRTWLPHKQLALCHYHLGNYQNSLQHNNEILKYLPNDKEALNNIEVLKKLI
ncbi:tetratricopeptide repeat-containing glycosyltransferase family 2 protein [Bacillus thuringiensis]|uniref:tetratricopeptide repeat-containing glycosyltransferase family 2 protein n=1 Tax=Bacillus thuringiensis TaxID=1428 RepID=UPI000CF9986C|nr:glycosyltransferase family 2 protein [Bacillus thuringiensis]PQQ47700.1 glycosyl transferase [Bacillus thuringiensis]